MNATYPAAVKVDDKISALSIRELGSFLAGGRTVTLSDRPCQRVKVARNGPDRIVDLNGDYVTGQCYVQFVRLSDRNQPFPVMFWHGGAMSGVTWETTPDGRAGWQMYFLRQGYDTYVCDAHERGRAGWSPYPDIYKDAPIFRTSNEAWSLFRFGPADGYQTDPKKRVAFNKQQFPVGYFDQFAAQFVPRWTDHAEESLTAYVEALRRTGPVILISHSQGGNFALDIVQRVPELIKALVVIEPAAAPRFTAESLAKATTVPHLFVWGDFIDEAPLWQGYRSVVDPYVTNLQNAGGCVQVFDLPREGIRGNSHVPMMDTNSDEVAGLIDGWLRELCL